VLRYRSFLEGLSLSASTINLHISAIRRLADEATESGWLSSELARTGQGFMESIRPDDSTPLEPELQNYILHSADLSSAITLAITRSSGESSLRLLSERTLMEDFRFWQLAHFLNTTRLSIAQATSLGQLINVRRWGQAPSPWYT